MAKNLHFLLASLAFMCLSLSGMAAKSVADSPPDYPNIENNFSTLADAGEVVEFSFYPNPVKNVVNIKFKVKGDYKVKIYNVVGTKVKDAAVENDVIVQVDVSDLPRGIYFINYEQPSGKALTKTFTKE